jgi:nicotinate-nucleotide pyrophosphorylase (carboxylating)
MDKTQISSLVQQALAEDIGSGDITAQLVPAAQIITARVISRDVAVICGMSFVKAVFKAVDNTVELKMDVKDGDIVMPDQTLFAVTGCARSILTAERTALNFLQMLSGTATITHQYVDAIRGTVCKLLDTRKTIPAFRAAQKYAVQCGGGHNHRVGLFDAFLIKENHIMAAGSIANAVKHASTVAPGKLIEVEVESLSELQEALKAGVDRVMLDNFSIANIEKSVELAAGNVQLEVSGDVTLDNIASYAKTGVNFISVGAITKHVKAVDLSMRVVKS